MWACASQAFGGGRSPGAEWCATGPAMRGGSLGISGGELIKAEYSVSLTSRFSPGRPLGVYHEIARDRHCIPPRGQQQLEHHV